MSLSVKPYLREVSIDPKAEIDFASYPFSIPAVREIGLFQPHPDVTFLVGENGTGKSTVLEAIAVSMGLPSEGGTRNVHRQQQEVSALHDVLKLVWGFRRPRASYFLRAESMFNVISYLDEIGARPEARTGAGLHRRSHGEAFMEVLLGFQKDGLYLLDEPEAALSPARQLAALSVIDTLVHAGAQFIIATHSPILLSYPNAKIMCFDGSGITETAYTDTEHYAITRDFLNNYERRLEQLLRDAD